MHKESGACTQGEILFRLSPGYTAMGTNKLTNGSDVGCVFPLTNESDVKYVFPLTNGSDVKYGFQRCPSAYLRVVCDLRINPVIGTGQHEVAVDHGRVLDHVVPGELVLCGQLVLQQVGEPLAVFVVDKSVLEHAAVLVHPQPHDVTLVGQFCRLGHQDALEYFGQVAQVEGVVALGWRGQELQGGRDGGDQKAI